MIPPVNFDNALIFWEIKINYEKFFPALNIFLETIFNLVLFKNIQKFQLCEGSLSSELRSKNPFNPGDFLLATPPLRPLFFSRQQSLP